MPHSPVCLLIIKVHLVCVGSVNRVYLPAGTLLPPTITSAFRTNVVASSAPARQTSPNGTRSPKILRPRMRGLEKFTAIVLPSGNLHPALAVGLASWASLGIAPGASAARKMPRSKPIFHIFIIPPRSPVVLLHF